MKRISAYMFRIWKKVISLHKNNRRQATSPGHNNRMGSKEIIHPFQKKCSTFDYNSDAWAKLLFLSDQWFLWTWRLRHLPKTLKTCQNWDAFTCCILRGVRISSPLSIIDLCVNASVSCVESNPSNSADLPRAGKRERKIQMCPSTYKVMKPVLFSTIIITTTTTTILDAPKMTGFRDENTTRNSRILFCCSWKGINM